MFTIYLDGEAEALINELSEKALVGTLNRDEADLYRKIRKALQNLETNPRHPGLKSHEIDVLTECASGNLIWRITDPVHGACSGSTGRKQKKLLS